MNKNKKLIACISILSTLLIIYLILSLLKKDVYILKDEETFYKIQTTINNYIKDKDYINPEFTLKNIYYKKDGLTTFYYANGYIVDYKISGYDYERNINYLLLIKGNSYNIYELSQNQNENMLEKLNSNDYTFVNGNILPTVSYSEQNKLSSYLAEFLNLLSVDNKRAYDLLNDNTKKEYSSYDNFFTKSTEIYNKLDTTIKSYTKKEKKNYTLYEVIDNKNNNIKITEYSIMNYKIEY